MLKYLIILFIITTISCKKEGKVNAVKPERKVQVINFFAMDTPLSVKYISHKKDKILEKKIIDFINNFDNENSFYKANSYLGKLNNLESGEVLKIPHYFCDLLKISKEFLIKTEYKFNIAYKSPKEFRNFDNLKIDCKNNTIKMIKKGAIFDTGGIAKGLAIDKTGELLKKYGINNFMVNYGGDILICGQKPSGSWKTGIKDPIKQNTLLKIIDINNKDCYSIATSGDYERYIVRDGKKLSHIINPKTGKSVEGAHSITIIAKKAVVADTLATAISVGYEDNNYIKRMKNKFNLEIYLLTGKSLKLREIK